MKEKETKTKKMSFRLTNDEHEQMASDANKSGMDLSTYIRARVLKDMEFIVYDPSVITELRAYREIIRKIAQDIGTVHQRVDRNNYLQSEDLKELRALVKSVYRKMDELVQSMELYRKELCRCGNHKTFAN